MPAFTRTLCALLSAAALLPAGVALGATKHTTTTRAKAHVTSVATPATTGGPGQQPVSVSLPAATYNVTPTSALTLAQALSIAPAGSVIHLASGTYPAVVDLKTRTGYVTVTGAGDASAPVIPGAKLYGDSYVRFVSVKFTSGGVVINDSPYVHYNQRANNIQIINSEINCGSTGVSPSTVGIGVRGASSNVLISGDYVHNCVVGFASVSSDIVSSNVSIIHNTFLNMPGDGMDLGGLDGVTVDHNIIEGMENSDEAAYHNDGIQAEGNVANATITNNVIANSGGQLLLIQDSIPSSITHSATNRNFLVADNLIYGSNGYAVQSQGTINARFIGNTIWSAHWGALLIRIGVSGVVPTDTVVMGNILQSFALDRVPTPSVEDYNLINNTPSSYHGGAHDLRNVTPGFVNPATGDFRLTASSPALRVGPGSLANSYMSTGGLQSMYSSAPTFGAMGALQPGAPTLAYGAPHFS